MTTWLTILVALLIVVVIAHGLIRSWKERRDRLHVSPSLKKSLKNSSPAQDDVEEEPSYISELPNGGARVVGYRDPKDIPPVKPSVSAAKLHKELRHQEEQVSREPQQTRLNLNESVPILMQPAEVKSTSREPEKKFQRIEPTISNSQNSHVDIDDEIENDSTLHAEVSQKNTSTPNQRAEEADDYDEVDDYDGEDDLNEEDDYEEDPDDDEYSEAEYDEDFEDDYDESLEEDTEDWDESDDDIDDDLTEESLSANEEIHADDTDDLEIENATSSTQNNQTQLIEPEEVIVINVMAQRAQVFEGNALLDIVLRCGLRYGSMNIFHRYSGNKGEGTLLFSMANIVKPGTFDLDTMDEFTTLGVSLFLTLPLEADSLQSFELMLETAQAISQTLGGELKDEYRSVMTKQTIEHYRQRIRDFERKKLFRRPR